MSTEEFAKVILTSVDGNPGDLTFSSGQMCFSVVGVKLCDAK